MTGLLVRLGAVMVGALVLAYETVFVEPPNPALLAFSLALLAVPAAMGHNPVPPRRARRPPDRESFHLGVAREAYANGDLTLEELEESIGHVLAGGTLGSDGRARETPAPGSLEAASQALSDVIRRQMTTPIIDTGSSAAVPLVVGPVTPYYQLFGPAFDAVTHDDIRSRIVDGLGRPLFPTNPTDKETR